MSSYHAFLKSVFGNKYDLYAPYVYKLQLYCLFVVTFTLALFMYSLRYLKVELDKTFEERVRTLRMKYATAGRTGYD